MRIDAHHHFWKYDPVEYGWIDDEMSVIRRDFLPADLRQATHDAGVDAVVSVQARQTIEETRWLLDLARENDFIAGVVGWAPLIAPDVGRQLESLLSGPSKLKGVRHVLQGEPDERYMLRDDFNAGLQTLKPLGLAYDILIFERQLPQTIEFVDRHPDQVFVLDHVAKPRIRENVLAPWRENLRELTRRENVFCKISGMVTESDYSAWTPAQLRPYVDVVLDAFGPARLMAGSDWPVCLVACGYQRWWDVVDDFIAALSTTEREQVLGGTATRAYRL